MKLEDEIKELIINSLMLEDVTIEDIKDDEPLFGEGLGLDSIDALELAMALKNKYKLNLGEDSEENKNCFHSVNSIAALIREQNK